jgi:hypothetical protein
MSYRSLGGGHRRAREAGLAVAAVFSISVGLVAAPAQAATFGVDANLFVQSTAGNQVTQAHDTGTVASQTPVTVTLTASANQSGTSFATGTATAFYGYLDASGSGFTAPGPLLDGTDARVIPVVGGGSDASFFDTIVVTSDTLAVGSSVDLSFLLAGSASASTSGSGDETPDASMSSEFQVIDLSHNGPGANLDAIHGLGTYSQTLDDTVAVGDVLAVKGFLYGQGEAPDFDAKGGASFSFNDPATMHIFALTPDVTLTSASGHDYSATGGVPEPASWALLCSGFLALGGALRRRRSGLAAA